MALDYSQLPFIDKVKQNQKAFGNKVIAISDKLDIHPDSLMVVMNNESGLRSDIKNPTSSASGLIQFMETTAKALGTTTADLRKMSNVEQLDYVYKYMKPYAGMMHDVSDVYLSIFYPYALFQKDNWEFPQWAVKANPIFDINKDGTLTKGEFRKYVHNKYDKYLKKSNTGSQTNASTSGSGQGWSSRRKLVTAIAGVSFVGLLAFEYYEKKKGYN